MSADEWLNESGELVKKSISDSMIVNRKSRFQMNFFAREIALSK